MKMPKAVWLLVLGMFVNVTGASFLWPLNTIYINEHLGKSLSVAGIVLMLNSAASVVGNLVGGTLFDKIGGYKSVLTGIIITLVALIGLVINHDWLFYVVFLTIVGFGSGVVFPSMYAMAGTVWPEGGRKSFNAIYIAQNAGVAIGAALGGVVASFSFEYIFIANAGMYVLFFLVAFFFYKQISATSIKQASVLTEKSTVRNKANFHALMTLCVGYLLAWVTYVQWQSTIATHTRHLDISLDQYSLLWTINGALIVLGQPIINSALKFLEKQIKVQIMIGLSIFIVSFLMVAKAETFTHFLVAMIILTIGEMLVWPAVPAIANTLAPKGREGFYQGIVNSTATGGRMIGPLLGGILVDTFNINVMFYVLIGFLVVSIVTTSIYDRKLKKAIRQEVVSVS